MATQLAALNRLTRRLGLPDSSPAGADALDRASARFIAEVGYSPLAVADDLAELDGNGTGVLLLPAGPVTAVTSVAIDGQPVTDWTLSRRLGMLHRRAGWPWGFGNLEVVYSHGWAAEALPDDIADAVLEAAEAIHRLRPGVQSSTLGPQAVTFATGTTEAWARAVARYQRGRTLPA